MRKQVKRASKGETLVETLTAIVIISLASVALASMITAAAKLNMAAADSDTQLYTAVSELETGTGTTASGAVTVTVNGTRQVSFQNVDIITGGDGLLTAYDYTGGGA